MAWTSLKNVLGSKPRVLVGPILRKVTPLSVTVWLALQEPSAVQLAVVDANNKRVMEGTRHTVAIGVHLHLVAVTATLVPSALAITEGQIYQYDLVFTFDDGVHMTLATATASVQLAYAPFALPSFCLPPSTLNDLHLLAGSCRIPHGNGKDAFALADDLIAQAVTNPLSRPHQLLLIGDQIYADDVAAGLLLMLTDAANTLLGWQETLPVSTAHGGPMTADRLPPFLRRPVLADAGFTSEDLDAHVMSLGE